MDSRCTLDIYRTPDSGVGGQGAEDGRCQTQVQPTIFVGRRERRQARQGIAKGKSPEPATNGCSDTGVVVLVDVVVAAVVLVVVVVVVVVAVVVVEVVVVVVFVVVVVVVVVVVFGVVVVVGCACGFGGGGLGLVGRGLCCKVWG